MTNGDDSMPRCACCAQAGMMEGLVTCLLRLVLRREVPLEVVQSGAGD
jgi:hypothetical protein